jgi:dsRNA-specific ribonuclease
MQTQTRPSAEGIAIITQPNGKPEYAITEAQAYRSFANYIKNTLGLTTDAMRTMIESMIGAEIRKMLKQETVEKIIRREIQAAFADHFKTNRYDSPKEQMRKFIAEQIANQIKQHLTKRLLIETTIEELADVEL